ncbi:MAG TPA: pilus assembly protein PilC [Deltaproteobacteria bacterium]|nr:MAG: pilus assembly protein PilC [Deltaproteobacteria bacterium RIFOXYA2_FULL_55_11]HBA38708.1 pilus assembly protein PilC [Deltaproteobacteria bacterium]
MPVFVWEGKTAQGKILKGEMEAASQDAVFARLRSQRIQPIPARVREKGKGLEKEFTIPGFGAKVSAHDVMLFTRQFATMIDAGLPIVQGLDILSQQSENKAFRIIVRTIKQDVESGFTLADALKKHPKIFDDLYVNMVAAGEVGGVLNTILNRIAMFIEKSARLKSKVKGAMIYPATIVVVAVSVVTVLLLFVIPVFAELYGGMGKALPAPTQITINISNFFRAYFMYLAGAIVGIVVALKMYYKTAQGRFTIDGLLLKLPIMGDLIRKVAVARFSQNMSILLTSGVPILDGLAITAKTAGNKVVEKAIMNARISISQGRTVAEPLTESKIFPPMVCQMVAIGENTGALDAMLKKVADFYEEEVDNAVANLTSLMEPLIMVVLGVILGGLVISMYLPIFQLGSLVS